MKKEITNGYSIIKNGKVLSTGNIYVYVASTTTTATIYKRNNGGSYSVTSNPMPLTTDGKPQYQIFVENGAYDVVVKDELGVEVDKWSVVNNDVNANIVYNPIIASNMTALRAISVSSSDVGKIARLMGYNASGDKPAIDYVLVHDTNLTEDDGLTIESSLTGYYWVCHLNSDVVDVRHYGVFPNNVNPLPNIAKIRWYFPNLGSGAKTYNLGSGTMHNAVCDNGVILNCENSEMCWLYDCDISNAKVQGYIRVIADTIRTSVLNNAQAQVQPRQTLIIDSNLYNLSVNECDVMVYANFNKNFNATSCRIYGNGGKINSSTQRIHNCEIRNKCLEIVSNGDYEGNVTSAKDWTYCNDFVSFMFMNEKYVIDCEGNTISAIDNVAEDIVIHNAVLNNVELENTNAMVKFVNCTGTIKPTDSVASVNLEKSEINACTNMELVAPRFNCVDSTLNGYIRCYSNSSFVNCVIDGEVDIFVDANDEQKNITIEGCDLKNHKIVFHNRKNILPLVQTTPVVAQADSVYVDNVNIKNNKNVSPKNYVQPIDVVNYAIYEDHQGSYCIVNNGYGLRETRVCYAGSKVGSVLADNIHYDNSTHKLWLSNCLCIRALTFNFQEEYNKNLYGIGDMTPLYVKCQVHWKNSSEQDRKTKDTERKAWKVNGLWSSATGEYNIGLDWSSTKNNNTGLAFDNGWTIDDNCHDWTTAFTWNEIGDEDFDNLVG